MCKRKKNKTDNNDNKVFMELISSGPRGPMVNHVDFVLSLRKHACFSPTTGHPG